MNSSTSHDWKGFQRVFNPGRRETGVQPEQPAGPVYFVCDEGIVRSAYADHEDLSEWVGARRDDVAAHFGHRESAFLEAGDIDRWLAEAGERPHYLAQLDHLKKSALPALAARSWDASAGKKTKGGYDLVRNVMRRHFLLRALESWWSRVLPSSYGIFVRVLGEGGDWRDFLLVMRRGEHECFLEPDLSSLGDERMADPEHAVKYLSEKYGVPVQGLLASEEHWNRWSASSDPWAEIAAAIKRNDAKLVPFRWAVVTLTATKAFLGF